MSTLLRTHKHHVKQQDDILALSTICFLLRFCLIKFYLINFEFYILRYWCKVLHYTPHGQKSMLKYNRIQRRFSVHLFAVKYCSIMFSSTLQQITRFNFWCRHRVRPSDFLNGYCQHICKIWYVRFCLRHRLRSRIVCMYELYLKRTCVQYAFFLCSQIGLMKLLENLYTPVNFSFNRSSMFSYIHAYKWK